MSAAHLHHELSGPAGAPVVVLANSLGSSTAMWDDQLGELRARFRVLRYDHRGHGGSEVPPGPYTIDDLGDDLLGLLDRLGIAHASLCGLSLGGMVGMWLAARAPERVDRLVLCCTSALLGPPSMWAARAAQARAEGTASLVATMMARWFTPGFRARAPQAVARAAAMLAATPDEGYAGCCEAIGAMDLRAELPSITAPTLVVAGAEDPATPPSHAEAIAAAIPGARLALLAGTAHLASIEQPQHVTRLLLEHLGATEAS